MPTGYPKMITPTSCRYCDRGFKSKPDSRKHEPFCKDNPSRKIHGNKGGHPNQSPSQLAKLDGGWGRGRTSNGLEGIPKSAEQRAKISKSHLGKVHSEETKKKIAEARKLEWSSGQRDYSKIPFKWVFYKGRNYRSSWEVSLAEYCDLAGIEFEYETIRVRTHKVWINDFLIDGEIYEVGWHPHSESQAAFESEGWTWYWFDGDHVNLIRMFL